MEVSTFLNQEKNMSDKSPVALFVAKKIIEENDPVPREPISYNGNYGLKYGDNLTVVVFVDCGEYDYIDSIVFHEGDIRFGFDELNGDFEHMDFSHYLSEEAIDKIEKLCEDYE